MLRVLNLSTAEQQFENDLVNEFPHGSRVGAGPPSSADIAVQESVVLHARNDRRGALANVEKVLSGSENVSG